MLRSPALFHQWAFLVGVVVICVSFTPGNGQGPGQFFTTSCTSNDQCTAIPGSQCMNTTSGLKCSCSTELGYNKSGSICRVDVEIGRKCNDIYAFCKQPKSECAHAGDLSSDKRCKCMQDYVAVKDNTTLKCAKVLTKQSNSNCTTCINNEGTCYLMGTQRKCQCPISRKGLECQEILVKVQCEKFSLDICYQNHPDVNITLAQMFTHGYGTKSACRATLTTKNDTFCPPGRLRLKLDLSTKELATCGVQRMTFNSDYIRYVTMMDVIRSSKDLNPIMFKTYCEYQYRKNAQVETAVVGVKPGINLNDRGDKKSATAKFYVQDQLGKELKSGDSVTLGDPVSLTAMVTEDGIYTGIHVRRCIASSSPMVPDPKASTALLYEEGCPAKGQSYIPATGRWRRILGKINMWTTGLFPMFKLSQGTSVYLHCTFRFCMGNDTSICYPSHCGEETPEPVTTGAPVTQKTVTPDAVTQPVTTEAAPQDVTSKAGTSEAVGTTEDVTTGSNMTSPQQDAISSTVPGTSDSPSTLAQTSITQNPTTADPPVTATPSVNQTPASPDVSSISQPVSSSNPISIADSGTTLPGPSSNDTTGLYSTASETPPITNMYITNSSVPDTTVTIDFTTQENVTTPPFIPTTWSSVLVTISRAQQCEGYFTTLAGAFQAIEVAFGLPPGTLTNATDTIKDVFLSKCTGTAAGQAATGNTTAPTGGATTAKTPTGTTAKTVANTTAAAATNTTGKRKKRSLAQQVPTNSLNEAQMSFAIKTTGDESGEGSPSTGAAAMLGMSNAAFVGFMAGVVIILLLLMVISAILLVRLRKGGSDESDKVGMSERPQRFAIPRNNHLRL